MLPTTFPAAAFLAQTPPLSTGEWSQALFAILILIILLVAVSTIWKNLRSEPSLDKQIDQKIATVTSALEKRIDWKLDNLQRQFQESQGIAASFRSSLTKSLEDLQRAMGRIEGKLDSQNQS